MIGWLHVALIFVSAGFLSLLIFVIIRRWVRPKRRNDDVERAQNLQNGIARLHQVSPHHGHHLDREPSKKASYNPFRRGVGVPMKPAFSWADHPSLVTDAVENGWSRFAFAALTSSPSVKSAMSLLGACAGGDHESGGGGVEIGWEVCEGSVDFMQKIRLNPNVKKVGSGSGMAVIRAALPLPGPNLGNSSFPQEAYFEVTIVSCNENARDQSQRLKRGKSEGDKIKLIDQDFNAKNSPESLNHAASAHSQRRSKIIEEIKVGKNEGVCFSIGLTAGTSPPLKTPGTFAGSVAFNSTASVYLDGTKLISDSKNGDWGRPDKVIGCGYNPGQKKVIFTVDSQVVHEIHCKTEDFCSPLYPTITANADVVILVNLGQSPFKFTPANLQRTPNPCFIGPMGTSPALGYEDSRELFSMGRIDSQWLQRSATRSNNNTVNSIKAMEEYDQESEGDLFEIVLDSSGRSPYTTLNNY